MKRIFVISVALAALAPWLLRAVSAPYGEAQQFIKLTSIQVTKTGGPPIPVPMGKPVNVPVIYHLEGHPEAKGFEKYAGVTFKATCAFDPKTHQAEEIITFPTGTIKTIETCTDDPWIFDTPCANGKMSATGESLLNNNAFQGGYPISARRLFPESRQRLRQAYDAAKPPTPTPTPTPVHKKVETQKPTATPVPKGIRMIGSEVQHPTPTPHP